MTGGWDETLLRLAGPGVDLQVSANCAMASLRALREHHPKAADLLEASAPNAPLLAHSLALGADLSQTAALEGFGPVAERLRAGNLGATAELRLAAHLVRRGCRPSLEPSVNGKVLDLAIDTPEGIRVYLEVISPGFSDEWRALENALRHTVEGLWPRVAVGLRIQVGVGARVAIDTVQLAVAEALSHPVSLAVREISPGIHLRVAHDAPDLPGLDLGPSVCLGATKFEHSPEGSRTLDVKAAVADERVENLIRKELHHFDRQATNVLVIDAASVPGALRYWPEGIKRRFQPSLNTRLGGIALTDVTFDGLLVPCRIEGELLINPYAARPLPGSFAEILGLDRH